MINSSRVLLVIGFLSVSLIAQQQRQSDTTIQIGGIDLWIGMSQDDALTPLANLYDVRHQDNMAGLWTVFRRGGGPPYEITGSLNFDEKRLVAATKFWGPGRGDQSAESHAAAVFDAMTAITNGRGRSCTIQVDQRPQVRSTLIFCGRKTVHVYSPTNGEFSATVDETVHK